MDEQQDPHNAANTANDQGSSTPDDFKAAAAAKAAEIRRVAEKKAEELDDCLYRFGFDATEQCKE